MKRTEQLQDLSREHHQSLTLSQKAIKISESDNSEAISELCKKIVNDYPDVWKIHFKIEEDSIFQLFTHSEKNENNETKKHAEIVNLCQVLIKEHQTMNDYYEQMKEGDYSILGDFGTLLKAHTRKEERELFPLIEEVMTIEALDHIAQVSRKYRYKD